jgi:predicted secreted protein
MSRPSTFTEEIAEEICERLSEGEPLRQICRDDRMPAWRTVYAWKAANPDFDARIARAREAGFDAIAHECLEIADETAFDTIQGENGDRANSEWISRSKLRVETRLKLLAKWDPKRYGDKITQEHTGAGGGPVQIEKIERVIVRPPNRDA